MLRRIVVGDNERVLLIRKRRFREILGPGLYWKWDVEIERQDTKTAAFTGDRADFLIQERPDVVARHFILVETGRDQVAAVYFNGKLRGVQAPSNRAVYWRGAIEVSFDLFDVRQDPAVPERLIAPLAKLGREAPATFALVDEGKRGLLYLDGRFVRELEAGTYAFWNVVATPRVDVLEIRRQTAEVAGQEILTKDKIALRVNMWAVYEIADAVAARSGVKDVTEHLYRTLQIAVRQTLGKRTLEEVLAEKTDLDEAVSGEVRREMEQYGVRVGEIALKDIILPGEIRDILNQVTTAEKQAQANLIRRREETAATRSLLNTAKLMEDNPLLVRLKELETLEKIADKVDKITVIGGMNELLQRTINLRTE